MKVERLPHSATHRTKSGTETVDVRVYRGGTGKHWCFNFQHLPDVEIFPNTSQQFAAPAQFRKRCRRFPVVMLYSHGNLKYRQTKGVPGQIMTRHPVVSNRPVPCYESSQQRASRAIYSLNLAMSHYHLPSSDLTQRPLEENSQEQITDF